MTINRDSSRADEGAVPLFPTQSPAPRSHGCLMSHGSSPDSPAPPVGARGTVLAVEDDDGVRRFVQLSLEQAGYVVIPAADGEQALALFRADPNRIDLVLTDVVMPNRNGLQLAVEVRRLRPGIPVLFMSGYVGGTALNPIELPPGVPLLEKPFSLDCLLQAVAAQMPNSQ